MNNNFFFESHYFAGGQKYYPFGTRPEWAPLPERAGISENSGLIVQEGDYVLELTRLKQNDLHFTWIGLFEKSIDKAYGDRAANTSGMGIWIKDALVLNPEELAEILHKLLTHQGKLDDVKTMAPNIEKAAGHVKLAPRQALPDDVKDGKPGLSFAEGSLHQTLFWHAKIESFGFELYSQMANFISLFQLMNRRFIDGNKLYVVISKHGAEAYKGINFSGHVPSTKFEFNEELAQMILSMAEKARTAASRPASDFSTLEQKLKEKEVENKDLKAQLQRAEEDARNDPMNQLSAKVDQLLATTRRPKSGNQPMMQQALRQQPDWISIAAIGLFCIILLGMSIATYVDLRSIELSISGIERKVEEAVLQRQPDASMPDPQGSDPNVSAPGATPTTTPSNKRGIYGIVNAPTDASPNCSSKNIRVLTVKETEILMDNKLFCRPVSPTDGTQISCSESGRSIKIIGNDTVLVNDLTETDSFKRCAKQTSK